MKATNPPVVSQENEIQLKMSAPEFLSTVASFCDKERPIELAGFGLKTGKPFICKSDGKKFMIRCRQPYNFHNSAARVLYGEVVETPEGALVRYHLAIRKELIVVLMLIVAFFFVPMEIFFIVMLLLYPPAVAERGCYALPLVIPLFCWVWLTLIIKCGVALGRADERKLLNLVEDTAVGKLTRQSGI